jgi:hypothetical protein
LVNVYLFSQGPYFGKNGPSFSDQVGPGPSTFKFLADLWSSLSFSEKAAAKAAALYLLNNIEIRSLEFDCKKYI